jgi:hypothetical protein
MRILGVNGIYNRKKSNDSFTDNFLALLSQLPNVTAFDVQYPKMYAFLGYFNWAIKRRAKFVAEANVSPDDIVIAHSFGCLCTIYAMKHYGARFDKVIFFGAAAESDIDLPDSFNVLYNIHSRTDLALTLGDILPFHEFGEMGQKGYNGNHKNVINIDATGHNHNDYVNPKNICNWNNVLIDILNNDWGGYVPGNLMPRPAKPPKFGMA